MERVEIREIAAFEGREVELRGWLYNKRSSGRLHFLQVRDGTGLIQCVLFKGDVGDEVFEHAGNLPQESAIVVRGEVRQDERSVLGYELESPRSKQFTRQPNTRSHLKTMGCRS